MKRLALLLSLALLPPSHLAAQQQSPLVAALRLAQDGRIDSARATLKRLEQSTVPTDTLFPGILYSSALVAPTAEEVRRQLQRVIVEYPFSPWAAPSMIALAQLDYANGDPAAAGRALDKFRTDHAASPLYATAALWGARAAFDVNNAGSACQWVSEGLARPRNDPSTTAELMALSRRCATTTPASAGPAATQVPAPAVSAPLPAPDTAVKPVVSTASPAPAAAPIPTAPATNAAATVNPPPITPSAAAPLPPAYRVQIVAANSQEAADEMLERAQKAGFKGVIVKDGGYFKVRLGEYATRAEATAAASRIKAKLGGSPYVVAP